MQIIAGLPWGKPTRYYKQQQMCIYQQKCPKHQGVSSNYISNSDIYLFLHVGIIHTSKQFPAHSALFSTCSSDIAARCFQSSQNSLVQFLSPSWQSSSVKGFGVPARIVGSVLRLHFLLPGHAPVPRRNRLQHPGRIGFRAKWRIQGTEGGGWRREV